MDREKVIKGLRHCTAWAGLHECQPKFGPDCPYEDEADCKLALMRDALTLLKEQEAVEPITEHHLFLCPVCKNTLFREQKFCHECGKRINWEGR